MATTFRDYYDVLQISRTASTEEIKTAYRRLARQHHPDLHPEKEKELHTKRMQEVNEAYAVLSHPDDRAKYDQLGRHWKDTAAPPPPPGGPGRTQDRAPNAEDAAGFSDFFRNMFRGQETAQAPEFSTAELSIEAVLELSLEEAVRGVEKTFALMTAELCPTCHGTGRIKNTFCALCGGVGEIRKPREVKAKIPAGLNDGARIRLKGQGNVGPKGRGDLYLEIQLRPDPRFKVDGRTLESSVRILPWQAALGSETSIPTLEGSLRVKIAPGTHTGTRLRLAGKGLGKPGARGDLFVRLEIDTPSKVSPKAEALYRQLEEDYRGPAS